MSHDHVRQLTHLEDPEATDAEFKSVGCLGVSALLVFVAVVGGVVFLVWP